MFIHLDYLESHTSLILGVVPFTSDGQLSDFMTRWHARHHEASISSDPHPPLMSLMMSFHLLLFPLLYNHLSRILCWATSKTLYRRRTSDGHENCSDLRKVPVAVTSHLGQRIVN
ncbi:hypothetical protein Bca4012_093560 [Brassica carinata]